MTYNITGVKLTPPNSGNRYFDISVPNGNKTTYITFRFNVDSNGNVNINSIWQNKNKSIK